MGIARHPSVVTLPAAGQPYPTILEFLARAFPHVSPAEWLERMRAGKVTDARGAPVTRDSPFVPGTRIFYFREVPNEPVIPFVERIVLQNDEILVADKPHFLPVTPGGDFVEECLLNRLLKRTGIAGLVPMHRLDRETAGLVLFSVNRRTRGLYHHLFAHGEAGKTYEALARLDRVPLEREWTVENRIERGEPRFRMQVVPGAANARSVIHLVEATGNRGRFRLHPLTGKTHQLRLHMSGLGFPILNDRVYPTLLPESADDYDRPLQLIAKRLRFRDPVSGRVMEFESERELKEGRA
jgi:tRNA pseudouridine32 synthase/23S rRNA pseudouridine746 synthase